MQANRTHLAPIPEDPRLRPGAIYVVVHLRAAMNPNEPTTHWGLYHHVGGGQGGHKMHILNHTDPTGHVHWRYEETGTHGVLRSSFLVGIMRIGYCAHEDHPRLTECVGRVSLTAVPQGYTFLNCQTWVMAVIRVFRAAGYVRCNSVTALENEVRAWINENFEPANQAVLPRPVADSTLCQLTQ